MAKSAFPASSDTGNDFDDRFAELEQREAKREQKLIRKTLGQRKQKLHGKVSHV